LCPDSYGAPAQRYEGPGIVRELRTNERIRAREVLVIGESGERLGVLPIHEALAAARERDLDLVEVAPGSVPPVCRILDYGKYKYEQAKKDKGATKHAHHGELREVRFKVKISPHDLEMKVRRGERFLREGDKVKVSVMFRGREIVHPEIGRSLLERVAELLSEVGVVDKPPTMEGRFFNMILAPAKVKPPKPAKDEAPPAEVPVATEG
jgi:translation initiation factor IF-3